MTRYVLILGGVGAVVWLSVSVLSLPFAAFWGHHSLFDGMGDLFEGWIALFCFAAARDYLANRRTRNAANTIAATLAADPALIQTSDDGGRVTVPGNYGKRAVTATVSKNLTGRYAERTLEVKVAGKSPLDWSLRSKRIRNGSDLWTAIYGRWFLWHGVESPTGDPELDRVVVLATNHLTTVRNWLRDPAVKANVLALFREHNVSSVVSTGSLLWSESRPRTPFSDPVADAPAIVACLCALAESAEATLLDPLEVKRANVGEQGSPSQPR